MFAIVYWNIVWTAALDSPQAPTVQAALAPPQQQGNKTIREMMLTVWACGMWAIHICYCNAIKPGQGYATLDMIRQFKTTFLQVISAKRGTAVQRGTVEAFDEKWKGIKERILQIVY